MGLAGIGEALLIYLRNFMRYRIITDKDDIFGDCDNCDSDDCEGCVLNGNG